MNGRGGKSYLLSMAPRSSSSRTMASKPRSAATLNDRARRQHPVWAPSPLELQRSRRRSDHELRDPNPARFEHNEPAL